MSRLIRIFAFAISLLFLASPPRAAFDLETSALPSGGLELLVVEVEDCVYCLVFRRDVFPSYEASARARTVPMRFVDISKTAAEQLGLAEPVQQVPTVLLMKDGREVGRISGYVGPENFFHAINRLMSTAP